MTDFEQYVLGETARVVDKQQLQTMAKKAAARFVKDKVPLNDSIESLSKEAALNQEQVNRVVEMANTQTFLHLFRGGYDTNVEFDVADASAISKPTGVVKQAAAVYAPAATYVPGQEYVSLEAVFATSGQEKVAEDVWTAEREGKFLETVDVLKNAAAELEMLEYHFNLQLESVKVAVDNAIKVDDARETDALYLVQQSGVPLDVLQYVAEDLGSFLRYDLDKTAEANTEHPLYVEGFKLANAHRRFFGTLDLVTGAVAALDDEAMPGIKGLARTTLGKYHKED